MKLDIATLCFLLFFISILFAAGLFFQARINKNLPVINLWAWGYASIAGGSLFLLARHYLIVGQLVIILANVLLLSGLLLISVGITNFFEKKDKKKILLPIYLVSILSMSYFMIIQDNINIRTAIFSLASAFISLVAFYDLWNHEVHCIKKSSRFLSIVFILYAIFFVIRSVSSLYLTNADFFTPSAFQVSPFLLSIACCISWVFGLIVMINQRFSKEKEQAQEHFFVIFDTGPDIAIISHFETGKILNVNKNFTAVTGHLKDAVLGRTTTEIKLWQSREERDKFLQLINENGYCENLEFLICKKDGSSFTGLISSNRIELQGKPHLISLIRDITDRKLLENELKQQAHFDMLTELYNRRYFVELVERELLSMERYPKAAAFLMMDMDHFKQINDAYGHAFGDVALKAAAQTCKDTLRNVDILCRIGGEEFAAFIHVTGEKEALDIADRLRHNVEIIELFSEAGAAVHLRISIGVTMCQERGESLEELMSRSDQALYQAKEQGRNRVVLL